MDEIKDILKSYKDREGMTWQRMADTISETPGLKSPVTRSQLNNWAVGVASPDYYFMAYLYMKGSGWVSHIGLDLIRTMGYDG